MWRSGGKSPILWGGGHNASSVFRVFRAIRMGPHLSPRNPQKLLPSLPLNPAAYQEVRSVISSLHFDFSSYSKKHITMSADGTATATSNGIVNGAENGSANGSANGNGVANGVANGGAPRGDIPEDAPEHCPVRLNRFVVFEYLLTPAGPRVTECRQGGRMRGLPESGDLRRGPEGT